MMAVWVGEMEGCPFRVYPVENCSLKAPMARMPLMVLDMSHVSKQAGGIHSRSEGPHPVSYPNSRPPEATKMPIMMAGADDPATLSGFRQPMAKAMADGLRPSSQGGCDEVVEDGDDESLEESTPSIAVDHLPGLLTTGGGDQVARQPEGQGSQLVGGSDR